MDFNAAEVLRHMGPKEVQKIGLSMAKLQNVPKDHVEGVMADFMDVISTQTALGVGADGYIRKMLVNALGEDKAGTLVDRILTGGNKRFGCLIGIEIGNNNRLNLRMLETNQIRNRTCVHPA